MSAQGSQIIVGVDGSRGSDDALRWAAQEALRRDAELTVLHVYDWRLYGAASPIGASFITDVKQVARSIVDEAVEVVRSIAPSVPVRGEALLGAPGATLVAAAANGSTVVVGNRGRGGFASLLLGSVSQQVATHAVGPVVVVRGRSDPTGPIVVGVDEVPAGQDALAAAFAESVTRHVGIVVVRVFMSNETVWGPDVPLYVEAADERREAVLEGLAADIAPWQAKYPDVDVECVALDGHAAEVLIGLSTAASLVVVGTRGRGGFAGLMLGSVSQHLLHHADCPVLIAREFAGELT